MFRKQKAFRSLTRVGLINYMQNKRNFSRPDDLKPKARKESRMSCGRNSGF